MAQATRTQAPARNRYAEDPAPGSVLAAPAGGQAEAEFNFNNDSPDVASFYLQVAGLVPDWLSGVGPEYESMAAAFGSSSLRLSLTPPLDAEPGDYDYQVSILSGGAPIASPIALVLRVEPPDVLPAPVAPPPVPIPAVAPPPPETVVPEAAAPQQPARPKTTRSAPRRAAPPAPDMAPEPTRMVVAETPPVVAEEPVVVFAPAPVAPVAVRAAPPEPAPEALPEVLAEVIPAPPRPAPIPRPVPSRPAPAPPPILPEEIEDEPVLVDMTSAPQRYETDEAEEEPRADAEASALNPEEGQVLAVRPGETLLVRFSFTNDAPRTRTYILDEDRSLGDGWLSLVQDQVNLTRNGTGEVALRLSPPRDAAPGEYPFSVTVGPEGGTLAARLLILSVLATPAVRLTTKTPTVKAGPFASSLNFPLEIETAGNAETAFRLGVQAPQADTDPEDSIGQRPYVYEAPNWRYLFDKELDTLRAPAAGRTPRPVPISLRLQRRGIWWIGWKEAHTVQVVAVPVTDATNGGKTANTAQLTAVRWRILPFPFLVLVPIVLLLLILLSGGASNLEITNAQHFGDSYYVLQSDNIKEDPGKPAIPMTAQLDWSAPWYSPLTLKATSDNKTDSEGFAHGHAAETYSVTEYGKERTYSVSPLLVAGNASVTARFIPARTENKLKISVGEERRPIATVSKDLQSGDTVIPNGEASATVVVPRGGTLRLNLENATPAAQGLRIDVWIVQTPTDFGIDNVTTTNSNPIAPGEMITAQIKAKVDSPASDQELTLVTTDATHQLLHIHLKAR